jgi:hypothetical protein
MYTSEIVKPLEIKMLKKLLAIAMLSMSGHAINAAAVPTFTDADWARIPYPGTFSAGEVMELFVAPLEKNGHEWTLASFKSDELRAVIADRQFEVRQENDPAIFAHQHFQVDRTGKLKIELALVSLTKPFSRQADDGDEEYSLIARLLITTQLTAEELTNPIVRAVQSPLTFEQESRLARENMAEYKRTIVNRNARNSLIFFRPDHADRVRGQFEYMNIDLGR